MLTIRRLLQAATLIFLALLWQGCDETSPESVPRPPVSGMLGEAEQRSLIAYDRRISKHCLRVSRLLVDPTAGPTPEQERRAFAAADELVELVAANATAPLDAGQDTRLFLADVIENLEGSNCDPRMVAVLSQGLGAIPVEP